MINRGGKLPSEVGSPHVNSFNSIVISDKLRCYANEIITCVKYSGGYLKLIVLDARKTLTIHTTFPEQELHQLYE